MSKLFTEPGPLRLEVVLNDLVAAVNQRRTAVLHEYGVNETDVEIINFLHNQDQDPKKMKEVGEHFSIKLSTLTSTIDKLEKNRLVRRKSSKDDRRVIYIQPTSRGQSLIQELTEPVRTLSETLAREMSKSDFEVFSSGMDRMLKILYPES
ncbi:MAG: MarR family transcriptional regulator [Bacteroidia bacterium]|nr:MarR family transcriptional regulator [Bacteroidia bacterium]